jgi:hypothetical protein
MSPAPFRCDRLRLHDAPHVEVAIETSGAIAPEMFPSTLTGAGLLMRPFMLDAPPREDERRAPYRNLHSGGC